MPRFTHTALVAIVSMLVAGCEGTDRSAGPQPTAPTTARSPANGTAGRLVNMMDACDAPTFNAAVGPGTCIRRSGVTFPQFLAQIQRTGQAGAWHFAPPELTTKVGETLVAVNRGGEVHTFTEVEEFGGGIVPILNELSGNTEVAPECLQLDDDDFVPPGGTYTDEVSEPGTEHYQCCIHPWMRATVHAH
jgi:plastocyanin